MEDAGKVRSETIRGDCSTCGGGGDPASSGVRKEYYYLELNGGLDGGAGLDAAVSLVIEDTVAVEGTDGVIDDPQYRTLISTNTNGQLLRQAKIEDPMATTLRAWCTSQVIGTEDASSSGSLTLSRVVERRMASAHTGVDTDAELKRFLNPTGWGPTTPPR